ncbi:MAG: hypothetical protein IPN76_10730 [Saprospiraceae bacterium]|nr:hypothetical protein [Saprospiraceae bacterium]
MKVKVGSAPVPPSPFSWYILLPIILITGLFIGYFLKKRLSPQPSISSMKVGSALSLFENAGYHLKRPKSQILPILEKVDNLIADGNLEEALHQLRSVFGPEDETLYADILSLASEHSSYQKEFTLGLNPDRAILNQITYGLSQVLVKVRESLPEG